MIFYFSGTGNSKWIAEEMAKKTSDKAFSIPEILNSGETKALSLENESALGIIFPIYAWDVPKLVQDFVVMLEVPENIFTYGICTCGAESGHAFDKMQKYFRLDSAYTIEMPDNYIVLFDIEKPEAIKKKIETAREKTDEISKNILEKKGIFDVKKGFMAGIKSSVVSGLFSKFYMSTEKFTVNSDCISCGLCCELCPAHAIEMENGMPKWVKEKCTMCMACINHCPEKAIDCGNSTQKRGRYTIEEWLEK